ncbi:MAG: hypothetical protein KTR25_17555 [Myxococcales bacterium]|nr:hypothetical protein [Myxococcales bacterium]
MTIKGPDHEKSLLGRVPPGTLASSSERFTKAGLDSYHTGLNQPAASEVADADLEALRNDRRINLWMLRV